MTTIKGDQWIANLRLRIKTASGRKIRISMRVFCADGATYCRVRRHTGAQWDDKAFLPPLIDRLAEMMESVSAKEYQEEA